MQKLRHEKLSQNLESLEITTTDIFPFSSAATITFLFHFFVTGEDCCAKESDKVDTDDEGIEQDHCDEDRSPASLGKYEIVMSKYADPNLDSPFQKSKFEIFEDHILTLIDILAWRI